MENLDFKELQEQAESVLSDIAIIYFRKVITALDFNNVLGNYGVDRIKFYMSKYGFKIVFTCFCKACEDFKDIQRALDNLELYCLRMMHKGK